MVTPAEGPPPSSPNPIPTSEPLGRAPHSHAGTCGFPWGSLGCRRVRSIVGLTRSQDPPKQLGSREGLGNAAPKCQEIPGRDPKQGGPWGARMGEPGCRRSSVTLPLHPPLWA